MVDTTDLFQPLCTSKMGDDLIAQWAIRKKEREVYLLHLFDALQQMSVTLSFAHQVAQQGDSQRQSW